ncbi:MAG: MFS transporter [Deltaproteobacteria bacterium]|nr:MAG: MFS transporter [Deltaproteobacteria bacterium]
MARRLHYAWVVAGTTFVVLLVGAAIRATPGVLMVPLERDLGWSRATISLAVSLNLLLYGMAGPFCAALAERLGVRRMMTLAMMLLAAAILLATQMTAPWQLVVLWGLVVGAGTGMTANVLGAVVATRWFGRRRGVVLGALTAATATGQLLFLPILARLAGGPGWRWALIVVGAAALVMVPLALLLIREYPADLGLRAFGAAPDDPVPPRRVGNPITVAFDVLGRASRTRDFWLLAGTFFICGASINGLIGTHFISACIDHGIPEVTAAGMLATMGIFDLFGTTGSGWLSDRIDSRWLLFTYYGLRGLSLIFLPRALLEQSGLSVFTVFYGLDWIATVPPTVKLSADAFGPRDAPIVFGWVLAAHQIGASTAALGAGIVRTSLGDYRYAFVSSGMLCLVAAGLALTIARGARRAQPAAA